MKRTILSLLVLVLLSCSTEKPNADNVVEGNEIITKDSISEMDASINQTADKSEGIPEENEETKQLKAIATSFHRWYLKNVNHPDTKTPVEISIVEGEAGKSRVEQEPYFEQLRKLPTVSEKFIQQEKQRVASCAENIGKLNWTVYKVADAYEYDDYCGFLYYYYWIRSQEPFAEVEVSHLEKSGDSWLATLRFFDEFESKKNYADHFHPIVKLEKEGENWKITQITSKEK